MKAGSQEMVLISYFSEYKKKSFLNAVPKAMANYCGLQLQIIPLSYYLMFLSSIHNKPWQTLAAILKCKSALTFLQAGAPAILPYNLKLKLRSK